MSTVDDLAFLDASVNSSNCCSLLRTPALASCPKSSYGLVELMCMCDDGLQIPSDKNLNWHRPLVEFIPAKNT